MAPLLPRSRNDARHREPPIDFIFGILSVSSIATYNGITDLRTRIGSSNSV